MNIQFINHSCFILKSHSVSIINDPWLFGSAFNDGWDLICSYNFNPERFRNIDYIWFSHEHPDHFSPPVLKSIPEDIRKNITVLFQETKDKKVLDYCQKLGFGTMELANGRRYSLAENFDIVCGKVPFFDSWILYDVACMKVLNINDCVVDGDGIATDIYKQTGDVDLLFTQFSYAAWKGNIADKSLREESAASKLDIVQQQIQVFHPRYTIPFASFIYFSHEENRYNNDSINTPEMAAMAIEEAQHEPVVMYPGDVWEVGERWDNKSALKRYEQEYKLEEKAYHTSESVEEQQLIKSAQSYVDRIASKNSMWLLRIIRAIPGLGFFRRLKVYLSDFDAVYGFSLWESLVREDAETEFDVKMHSNSLDYIFKFDWGYDTLTVNGRFETDMIGFGKMTKVFAIGPLNNTGRYITPTLLFDVGIIKSFFRAMRKFTLRLRKHGV